MADVVSTGEAFSSTGALREVWPVTSEVAVGTALLNGIRAGVAYTNSGGFARNDAISGAPVTFTGIPAGGIGLDALKASVATDGTYEFAVVGANASSATGVSVYATIASGKVTGLTLTAGGTLWGVVNNPTDYVAASGVACVKIGV